MASKRQLPKARNPLLQPEHTPPIGILVERRRLGSTNLAVQPGQVGTSNATKPENLGQFDYVHLRAPLPKDLKGSGVFALSKTHTHPESYFLMRRSEDGFVSATGMFKAAFPWASAQEERSEREYLMSLPATGSEEVAGNLWMAPLNALELADEYHIRPWLVALLDPEPVTKGTDSKDPSKIAQPPTFNIPEKYLNLPAGMGTRARTLRSASPSKNAAPARLIASPRKRRTAARSTSGNSSLVNPINSSFQSALDSATSVADTESPRASLGPELVADDAVHVHIDTTIDRHDDIESTHTKLEIEMPAGSPDLQFPINTDDMLTKAKEMVEAANRLDGNRVNGVRRSKRKADELYDDEDEEDELGMELQPAKKQRVLEDELKKERVKTKALLGLSATLAIGALIPYFF